MAAAIEHVVVLMLENRSFDCMLGKLHPADATFDGLTGRETNIAAGQVIPVWSSDTLNAAIVVTPDPDPGELFSDMNEQLFDGPAAGTPTMQGFAANYLAQALVTRKCYEARSVLHYFTPDQVPVLSTLAKAFGVSDAWHASAPCQTWPNRLFAHTGTSRGYVDNANFPIPFPAPSIFRRLEDHGTAWRIYFHDVPQSLLLGDIWTVAPFRFCGFGQFLADAHTGALPNYSFIEPRYFADPLIQALPNDEHPPHNVLLGEQLVAQVYNAVRSSPCWKQTLLIITYDEHGGCYDHVAPPNAVPPDNYNPDGFDFARYGVRVPTVIISPYVPPGSRVRAMPHDGPPFDHTSILSTLRALFGLGQPFSAREAVAPLVLSALTLPSPSNDGPSSVSAAPVPIGTRDLVALASIPPNHMQTNLARMAISLPDFASAEFVPPPAPMSAYTPTNVATAVANALPRVKQFLNA